jgi:phosphocarrier protein HPr
MTITLPTVQDVKTFVQAASKVSSDIDIVSGRYKIDGKSIMGMFSLDLSKPLAVEIVEKEPGDKKKFIDMLSLVGIPVKE